MVKIFNEAESTTIPWEELSTQTPEEIIAKITGKEPDRNTYLTKCGVRFPPEHAVSDAVVYNKFLKVHENDFLRIVYAEEPSTSTEHPEPERRQEIEKLRKECFARYKEITTIETNRVVYMEVMNNLADVDFFQKMLNQFPVLRKHPEAQSYIADPLLLFSVIRDTNRNRDFCCQNPVILDVIKSVLNNVTTPTLARQNQPRAQQANGPLNLFGVNPPHQLAQQQAQRAQGAPARPANVITADMLQQAINFAMGGPAPAAAAAPANPPPAAVAAPDPLAQFRQQYAQELGQLREFGFVDDELNLSVLVQCEGNVATAMEILIDDANPQQ